MQFSKRLKIILQSNITIFILFLFLVSYIIIFTLIVKYDTNIKDFTSLEGIVTDLTIKEDSLSFILKTSEKVRCTYYKGDALNYNNLLGKKIRVTGEVVYPSNNTIPNTFNYKKYLYNNKIYLSYNVKTIKILANEKWYYKIKNFIIKRISNTNDLIKKYFSLFILGDKSYLEDSMYDIYRINGIWHLFAVSGMHIGLIILVLNKLLKRVKFKNFFISLFLLFFMFLTDFSASVMRATIFYILARIFNYFNISLDNKKILFYTAFIILILNPFMIYNTGFIYSFLVTYAIMLMSHKITGNYFVKILKISIISFITTLPITINLNYEINLFSIISNLFFVPFISLIVFPLTVITFLLPYLNSFLNLVLVLLEKMNVLIYNFHINIIIPKMNIWLIFIYYLNLYFIYKTGNKKSWGLYFLIIIINNILPKLDNNSYIYYLDVGQGDSEVIISPYKREVTMIDTGGIVNSSYHVADNTLLFLKSLGINKIGTLIITHGDYDHSGEAINIVNNFKVGKVIFNLNDYNKLELELIKVLEKKKINYLRKIDQLNINNVQLYFLNTQIYDNENDNSNVIYFKYYNYQFLFMGDAGVKKENDILEKYKLSNIDFLKVGHHGSDTSSSKEFIEKVKPVYSIISVGKKNRYGHPKESVLKTLSESHIYRTDIDGTIEVKLNIGKLEIITYKP